MVTTNGDATYRLGPMMVSIVNFMQLALRIRGSARVIMVNKYPKGHRRGVVGPVIESLGSTQVDPRWVTP